LGELTPGPVEDRAWLLLAGHTAVIFAADDADDADAVTTLTRWTTRVGRRRARWSEHAQTTHRLASRRPIERRR
jgi:hypothetical protein